MNIQCAICAMADIAVGRDLDFSHHMYIFVFQIPKTYHMLILDEMVTIIVYLNCIVLESYLYIVLRISRPLSLYCGRSKCGKHE